MNILVFPADTEIAREVQQSLVNNKFFTVFGGSSLKGGKGIFLKYERYFELPWITDSSFKKKLRVILNRFNIKYIIPCHDEVILNLKTWFPSETVSHPLKILNIALYKDKTFSFLKDEIYSPITFSKENIDLPCFLKPKFGYGSRGSKLIEKEEDLYEDMFVDNVVCEFLPGKEYTVDCFSLNGQLLFCGPRQKCSVKMGISEISKTIKNSHISKIAESLNEKFKELGGFTGAWFFQLKEDNNKKLKLLEIGPRIAGGMSLYRMLGVNFVELSILAKDKTDLKIKVEKLPATFCKFFTPVYKALPIAYKAVYIDFDDTLYYHSKKEINTLLVQYIFQCINKKIKVFLLTKSTENVQKILKNFRLDGIWDNIIHISYLEEKKNYITIKPAILIDDSFKERSINEYNVYTFNPTSLPILLE